MKKKMLFVVVYIVYFCLQFILLYFIIYYGIVCVEQRFGKTSIDLFCSFFSFIENITDKKKYLHTLKENLIQSAIQDIEKRFKLYRDNNPKHKALNFDPI